MIRRLYTSAILEMLLHFPVVALVGSRQVGKSTLITDTEVAHGRRYITLDDLTARKLSETDPDALISQDGPITIDEVQLVPELLRSIKKSVDRDRRPGRYLLTGSGDLNYLADLSNVLAGRVGIIVLPPITFFEERGFSGRPRWMEVLDDRRFRFDSSTVADPFDWSRILRGGFPLSVTATSERQRQLWFESFRQTYLERDLRRMRDVGHLTDFARLMELTAGRTAQIVNQASLARECGLNAATLGRYFSLLEASFLIKRLLPWHTNLGKRLVKSPKCYWTDTGLACHLCGITSENLPGHRMRGALFESFVVMELQALISHFVPEARTYYFRSQTGLELDMLIQRGPDVYPVEIKAAQTVSPDDAVAIKRWREWTGSVSEGIVFYAGTETKILGDNIFAVPVSGF